MGLAHLDDAAAHAALHAVIRDARFPKEVRAIASAAYGLGGGGIDGLRLSDRPRATLAHELGFYMEESLAASVLGFGAMNCLETAERLAVEARASKSDYMRPHYYSALALAGELSATDLLVAATRDRNRFVREAAVASLGGLLDDTGRLTPVRISERALDSEELARCRKLASRTLIQLMNKSADHSMRSLAAIALGRIGGRANQKALRFVLAEEHGQVRATAALALGISGARDAQDALMTLVSDTSEVDTVRGAAQIALGLLGDVGKSARSRLRSMLVKGNSPVLRSYACQALGLLDDAVSVPRLATLMASDCEIEVRLDASIALSLIGNRAALDAQRTLIQREKDADTQAAFVRTLGSHSSHAVTPLLVEMISEDQADQVRASALHALGHVVNPHAQPLHARLLCDRPSLLVGKPFKMIREIL